MTPRSVYTLLQRPAPVTDWGQEWFRLNYHGGKLRVILVLFFDAEARTATRTEAGRYVVEDEMPYRPAQR